MKLEELRKALEADVDGQKTELETRAPLCGCCKESSDRLSEYPGFGLVCFWCLFTCYDPTENTFDHSRWLRKTEDAIASASRCSVCGHTRASRWSEGKTFLVIEPCTTCPK
jgi:hypothetical protein